MIKCPHPRENYLIIQHKESQVSLAHDERKSTETPSVVEQNIANASHLISRKSKEEILGIFHKNTSSQVQFNIFMYKTKFLYAFGFHESAIFSLEYIKVCLRHDLSTHVESARLVT